MNILVVYESMYGNTEKIAQAIGKETGASVLRSNEVKPDQLVGLDALIVGSPTQIFQPLKSMKTFLKELPKDALKGVKVATFDTRMDVLEVNNRLLTTLTKLFGYAAKPMATALTRKGGVRTGSPAGFIVSDREGPLKDGELERALQWAKQVLQSGVAST